MCLYVAVCVREIGIEGKRAAISGFGRVKLFEGPVSFAEVVVECRHFLFHRNGAGYERNSFLVVAGLMRDQSQEVQSAGVVGIGLEHLPIQPFSLIEAVGGVMIRRLPEKIIVKRLRH